MRLEAVSEIVLALLLIGMLALAFNIQPVKAEPTLWTVDDDGPADFSSIQEAINAANPGDAIYVYNGTYYENVVVNKSVSLVGENQVTTTIDGSKSGYAIHIQAVNNVNITGFTIQHGWGAPDFWCGIFVESSQDSILSRNIITLNVGDAVRLHGCIGFTISENKIINNPDWGIRLFDSSDNNVSDNIVSNNGYGIDLRHSSNNVITNNLVTSNNRGSGIYLMCSPNNVLKDNNMTGNSWNLGIEGAYVQDIDTSNTVNGKPVYYLVNQRHLVIQPSTFPDIGYLGIVDSSAITVRDLHLTNNGEGILFAYTSGSVIENVKVSNNLFGICLVRSDENIIISNTISDNEYGIALFYSLNNVIHHNNFIDNTRYQVYPVDLLSNVWDVGYPLGGNYWSDYEERYPNATEIDDSGIWDTPYAIDENNQDNYPLMNPWTPTETMGLLIVYATYVSGDAILLVDPQGRIVETNQTFQTNGVEGFSTELPAGNYTIEVTYKNETKTKRAEILEGQTTYLQFDFGKYIGPPPIDPVGGIYIPVNKLELLAPYIGLTILLAAAVMTVGYSKKRKRHTEINS